MSMQSDIERQLSEKARNFTLPRLKSALAKLEGKLEAVPTDEYKLIVFEMKAPAYREKCRQYEADIATIEAGRFPGYNGKPFGAVIGAPVAGSGA